ncbi:IS1634 family transposase [Herbivorax sp. ANBcel31]|uniref:IS1634 family transposase n=1 Tax=Herbivorax sp. ANBcel31 TaxID=3069754 RepID=UPI0027B80BF8|nr:IS1634 family transposase [Herbivorax sp. ANBcel31]MDQ2088207.1 IS1634 family transposase [Herbivorax sp. ANBcel31]
MFIRENKTYNKKAQKTYIKHCLVESVWTEKGSRQRTIMNLGHLTIPRMEWKKLAHALECQLTGQQTLLSTTDNHIERLALSLVSNMKLSKKLQKKNDSENKEERKLVTIDLKSIKTTKSREMGPELVCQMAWDLLDVEKTLKKTNFSDREIAIAKAVIFGRLISPGSEMHTYRWFRDRSALSEFPGANISRCGKDMFYEVGDNLYSKKDRIEELLYMKERELFPHNAGTIFLYDLTNTYMEGSCLGNNLAERGHCKSKRTDCPLITLSLVVDGDGMPITSHIYKGNQSEPETMEDMIGRLESMAWGNQTTLLKPTVAMDRGIATQSNVDYLRANQYPYIIIKREDEREEYRKQFEMERDSFTHIGQNRKSAYGDENNVYTKKIVPDGEDICKVLCISDGKARKEKAIDAKKIQRFLDDINKFDKSIKDGKIKDFTKTSAKLERIVKKHKTASEAYVFSVNKTVDGKAEGIVLEKKAAFEETLYGCYVMESTHKELSDIELWKLYMTLTHVESAFRAMKSELGMRPVYHQNESRSGAHLFITVLAYHLLAVIERLLMQKGDHRQWSTIREVLSTHARNTVIITDKDGNTDHVRVSGAPESMHQEIYDMLEIKDPLKQVVLRVKTATGDTTNMDS